MSAPIHNRPHPCPDCGCTELVFFPGRWGSGMNWAENATICPDCQRTDAEDGSFFDSLAEENS